MTQSSNVTVPSIDAVVSCLSDYDPNALHVDRARAAMRACLIPLTQTERVPLRAALGRVLRDLRVDDRQIGGAQIFIVNGKRVSVPTNDSAEAIIKALKERYPGLKPDTGTQGMATAIN